MRAFSSLALPLVLATCISEAAALTNLQYCENLIARCRRDYCNLEQRCEDCYDNADCNYRWIPETRSCLNPGSLQDQNPGKCPRMIDINGIITASCDHLRAGGNPASNMIADTVLLEEVILSIEDEMSTCATNADTN
ncbi:MAG: hypothetical protein J0M12_01990 [Deltaproteobacteria bacterium]|nr:hypothetical protein [Deltaproteobacteria bacterium]